jgi:uncharacterized metal-binding protein
MTLDDLPEELEMSPSPPLVFACAGCSPAGKAAYDVAQELTARGAAEMSCLAGVAAELPYFQKQLADRDIWVIDGCPLQCALHVFRKQRREVAEHFRLNEHGVKKQVGLPAGMTVEEFVDTLPMVQPVRMTK